MEKWNEECAGRGESKTELEVEDGLGAGDTVCRGDDVRTRTRTRTRMLPRRLSPKK